MHKKLLLFLFLFSGFSCDNARDLSKTTYFGGTIINPTSKFVLLYKDEVKIDSVRLDSENSFAFKLTDLKDGIYNFYHHPQYQYVYLENGDSLQSRLNTIEFDESLVFSGDNEIINNHILQLFLQVEKEDRTIKNWYRLDPEKFEYLIDSVHVVRSNMLKELYNEHSFSDSEKHILESATLFNSYYHKEYYPYLHKKKLGLRKLPELSDNYYNFRNKIPYNLNELLFFKPYYDYLGSYFFNLSISECLIPCGFDFNSNQDLLHYHLHKLKLIDSLAPNKTIANLFTHKTTKEYFFKGNTSKNNAIFHQNFLDFNNNDKHRKEVEKLYTNIQELQTGKPIPKLEVLDINKNPSDLQKIASNGSTIFYFWSVNYIAHTKNILGRIKRLEQKHPNKQFVGICLNAAFMDWKLNIESAMFNDTQQYFCEDMDLFVNKLMISHRNKTIFTDDDGNIVDAFLNLRSDYLDKTLAKR